MTVVVGGRVADVVEVVVIDVVVVAGAVVVVEGPAVVVPKLNSKTLVLNRSKP